MMLVYRSHRFVKLNPETTWTVDISLIKVCGEAMCSGENCGPLEKQWMRLFREELGSRIVGC